MLTSEERRVLSDLAAAGGLELSDGDWELLALGRDLVPTDEEAKLLESQRDLALRIVDRRERWDELETGLARGAFHLAARGYEFVPAADVEAARGRPLRKSYPEANESFLRFARTYWTLSAWNRAHTGPDPKKEPMARVATSGIEASLTELFFPTEELGSVDPDQREEAQRTILRHYEVPIDVDDFMAGNPILMRHRTALQRGLLGRLSARFRRKPQ